jgi:hypothetical protein
METNGYTSEFIKFVTSNFTFVIEPFLDVAIQNDNFKTASYPYIMTFFYIIIALY